MTRDLHRRLERLEATSEAPLRQRYVWWDKGDPLPVAEPGEQLVIYSWTEDDEPTPEPEPGR